MLIRGATGTNFLSFRLSCGAPHPTLSLRSESKTRVPLTLAVVAVRHPLLDGHTHQVICCVPVKEWMRSGK